MILNVILCDLKITVKTQAWNSLCDGVLLKTHRLLFEFSFSHSVIVVAPNYFYMLIDQSNPGHTMGTLRDHSDITHI